MEALPAEAPAFLRTPAAAVAVGELAREPDRWKDAGKAHDGDLDPGHFLNLGDDGRIAGGLRLTDLPPTRAEYERLLRRAGSDGWRAGYLPYSIIEGWQQLAKDFAYLRADEAGARDTPAAAHRAWLAADGERRQQLILRDLGVFAHFVGDGSQPLHVSNHFDGWGPFPNPLGFTQEKVHAPFEGAFVRAFVSLEAVRARVPGFRDRPIAITTETIRYLSATNATVVPFYRLYQAGGFVPGDARGVAFAAARLAAGADELRDLVVGAWRTSAEEKVGWPEISVADVEAGRLDPFESLYGAD
ncbi:MAG TPA: S1/P1 Nuclease [Caulobacteraceae bacterium]|nr:S1/P1 Nuclease [Caulobacteraceae bacterium]